MAFDTIDKNADDKGDHTHDLAALARLVTYARNSAKDLQLEFSTYCLDLALGSLVEEISKCGANDAEIADHGEYTPSLISGVSH